MKIAFWIALLGSLSLKSWAAPTTNFEFVAQQLLNKSGLTRSIPPFSPFRDHFEHITNFNMTNGGHKIADNSVVMKVDGLDLVLLIEPAGNSFYIHVLANSAVGVPGWRVDSRGLFMKFAIVESKMWAKYGEEAAFINMFKGYLDSSDDFRRRFPGGPLLRQTEKDQFVLYEGFTHSLHSRRQHPLRQEILAEFLKMLVDPTNCETIMNGENLRERAEEKIRNQDPAQAEL